MTAADRSENLAYEIDITQVPNGMVGYQAVRQTDGKIIDFQLTLINDIALATWNRPQSAMIGQLASQLFPPTEAQYLIQLYSLVVESGRPVRFDMDCRWQLDGSLHQYDMLAAKSDDGVLLICREVGFVGRAVQDQREQMQFIDTLMNTVTCGVVVGRAIRDDNGQVNDVLIVAVNQIAATMAGYTATDMVGQRYGKLYPGIFETDIFACYAKTIETGEPQQLELYYGLDGLDCWATIQTQKLNDGLVITWTDITERKRAELLIQQQAEQYKAVLDNALTLILVLKAVRDEQGSIRNFRVVLVNRAMIQQTGVPEDKLVGNLLTNVVPGVVESGVFARYVAVTETQVPQQFDIHYELDGHNSWLVGAVSAYGDGVVASYTDISLQKETELRAQQQAQLLESIQQSSQMGIAVYQPIRNEAGTIVDVRPVFRNAASIAMTRATAEDATQKTLGDLLPPIKGTTLLERYAHVINTGQAEQFEHYYNNGHEAWYEISAQPWNDGILVNVLEVSKLRQYEREKIQQATLLQRVIDTMQAGMMLARPVRDDQGSIVDFRYVLTNEYNAKTTGLSLAELTGAVVGDLFPGWQASDMYQRMVQVMQSGEAQSLTFPFDSHGIKGWFDGAFSRVEDCLLYTYTNVTALKEAELAQHQYADLLERVMDTTPTAIVVHESIRDEAGAIVDFRMTHLNQSAAAAFNSTVDKVQYRRVSRYFPGLLDTPLFACYKQVVQTGESARLEVNWGDQWYDFSVARFGDGFVAAAQNITATQQYRHQLEVANHELKRSNENLQSFAYVASHDLQEPLRKINSFANILNTQYAGQFDSNATDIIRRMTASADRMRQLIQDLLVYSQVDMQLDTFRSVNLATLVQQIREEDLWVAIYQSKAQIRQADLPTLHADPLQMRQLFQNLLSNALKFCPKGVTPDIEISYRLINRADVPPGLLSPLPTDQAKPTTKRYHVISVTDNGIGFDEKYTDRIFQVFQRLHGRSQYVGSGIGLSICQKIMERHNGAIAVTSQLDKGSTFTVYLPG
ncbi:PAS domain-containing protein [Fibrella aquatilis]|uniref:histidine kinase n=1 Tax=Fibrella aquatilis TaxID=2817059 RepID=A0A939G3Y7_9BACT|nr:PAS domain-containing protein [Fibrella aquatilis]MBO0931639.1 PAS domain-containing protein [Fibrella aquatilis]